MDDFKKRKHIPDDFNEQSNHICPDFDETSVESVIKNKYTIQDR